MCKIRVIFNKNLWIIGLFIYSQWPFWMSRSQNLKTSVICSQSAAPSDIITPVLFRTWHCYSPLFWDMCERHLYCIIFTAVEGPAGSQQGKKGNQILLWGFDEEKDILDMEKSDFWGGRGEMWLLFSFWGYPEVLRKPRKANLLNLPFGDKAWAF